MGIINILALTERELETIKLLLEYAEKRSRSPEMKGICQGLLEKIQLKFYFSPQEEGKLHGLSERSRGFYYEFYERYDFDIIDFIERITEKTASPNEIYREMCRRFPVGRSIFRRYPGEVEEIIARVLNSAVYDNN